MKKSRFETVRRLLDKRKLFTEADGGSVSSVQAFLSWKALLFVKGFDEALKEREAIVKSVVASVGAFPELLTSIRAFAVAYGGLVNAPDTALVEWFGIEDPDTVGESIGQQVAYRRREIRKFVRMSDGPEKGEELAELSARFLWWTRHAVIGHPSVYTGDMMHDTIVPKFADLCVELALAGCARRAGWSLAEARSELT